MDKVERTQEVARWPLAAAYAFAGWMHVQRPGFFLPIVPGWVPAPRATVIATGLCELAGAAGLMVPRTRRLAGAMLGLYAVCVFPANIKHAVDDLSGHRGLGLAYHGPRLLAQPAIVWWALFAGQATRWPFRRGRDRAARRRR